MFKHTKLLIHSSLCIVVCVAFSMSFKTSDVVGLVSAQSGSNPLAITNVSASTNDGNVPENAIDGDLGTRWSGYGEEAWIRFDLGSSTLVDRIDIAFYRGDLREQDFMIETSTDGSDWEEVFEDESSGETNELQSFDLDNSTARYVRFVGDGNSENDWNSITEVVIYGDGPAVATNAPQPTTQPGNTNPPGATNPPLPSGFVIDETNDGNGATPAPTPVRTNTPRPSTSATPVRTNAPGATPTRTPSATVAPSGPATPAPSAPQGGIPTEPNLKIAFTGDTGMDEDYQTVLNLVKAEGAHALVIPGDLAYSTVPAEIRMWESAIGNTLGANYPYLISIGNHETESMWMNDYVPNFSQRLAANGMQVTGNLNTSNFAVTYKGVRFVFTDSEDHTIAQQQLANDNHIWKVCGWHKLMTAMQVGDKGDQSTWQMYETCRQYGAIIATAHEHSYVRTKTLSSMQNQTVDPAWPDPKNLRVTRGSTFAFVSAAGGKSVRSQSRCLTATEAGCGIWAAVRTSTQGANFGVFFITFNVDGNPRKATAYYKEIDGRVTDGDITITAN